MDKSTDHYEPSAGVIYAVAGIVIMILGVLLLRNVEENFAPFFLVGSVCSLSGGYLVLTGAVARGIQISGLRAADVQSPNSPSKD
jgi:hypothetical protein